MKILRLSFPLFLFFFICFISVHLFATPYQTLLEKGKELKVGIICAHPTELGNVVYEMEEDLKIIQKGMRTFYTGKLWGLNTVVSVSRVGKVAAASTATFLIGHFDVDLIFYVGVAGAIDSQLKVGDIVISNGLIQHDMDSRPFIKKNVIPLLNVKEFFADTDLSYLAKTASQEFLQTDLQTSLSEEKRHYFQIFDPKIYQGLILSGDRFIWDLNERNLMKEEFPSALCVEMEGAAVGQVCFEYQIPFTIIRIISDLANAKAGIDCLAFMKEICPSYSKHILKSIFHKISIQIE